MTGAARQEVSPRARDGRPVTSSTAEQSSQARLLGVFLCVACGLVAPLIFGCASLRAEAIPVSGMPGVTSSAGATTSAAYQRAPAAQAERAPSIATAFDEFAIRAAVKQVAPPPGTGLPNIQRLTIEPNSIFPIVIQLAVEGVDNAAWQELSEEEQEQYGDAVIAAVVARYPQVETTTRWRSVYYMVKVYERVRVSYSPELDILEDGVFCTRANPWERMRECRGISVAAVAELPTSPRA